MEKHARQAERYKLIIATGKKPRLPPRTTGKHANGKPINPVTKRFKTSKVSKNSKISNYGSVANTSEQSWRNVGEGEAAVAPALSGDLQRMSQLMKGVQKGRTYLPNRR
jgi:hypothetical protein